MKQLPAQTHKEKEGRKEEGQLLGPIYHPTCKWEGMRFFVSFPARGRKTKNKKKEGGEKKKLLQYVWNAFPFVFGLLVVLLLFHGIIDFFVFVVVFPWPDAKREGL